MAFLPWSKQARQKRLTRRAAKKRARADVLAAKGKPVRAARARKRAGILAAKAGVARAGQRLHRQTSPSGRKFRIYQGRKQKWSKKFGGWMNIKAPRRRLPTKKEVEDVEVIVQKVITQLMPLLLAAK